MNREQVKKIIKFTLIGIFVLSIAIYTGFEIRKYVTGPGIVITKPENGFVSNESLVEIIGKATNIIEVKVNDNMVFIDEEGNFNQKVLLSLGYNVLKISGVDRFGRETENILYLTYKNEAKL